MPTHELERFAKAHHFDWDFRREAFIYLNGLPSKPNMFPMARMLRAWLLRNGQMPYLTEEDKKLPLSITNPYSYFGSVFAIVISRIINEGHAFATSTQSGTGVDDEIQRIRLYNEQVLYTTRFCEAAIKQLLYCTQIPASMYKSAALGALLARPCSACKKDGRVHDISILGSLAHRYGLCIPFDQCLFDHLAIANRRRNVEAAHSDSQRLWDKPPTKSNDQFATESKAAAEELVHMLGHIGDLEGRIIDELVMVSRQVRSSANPSLKPQHRRRCTSAMLRLS